MIRLLLWGVLAYVFLTALAALLRLFVRPRSPGGPREAAGPGPGQRVQDARWEEIPGDSRENPPRSKGEP